MSTNEKTRKKVSPIPCINWIENFPKGELPSIATEMQILLIAIDTEYQSNYTRNTNLCLSYQYCAYDMQSGKNRTGIFYMDVNKQERLSMGEFTKRILEEMDITISSLSGYRIIFIAHFFTAEWAMFRDKKELYMKFEYIRKTLITIKTPLETKIHDENNEVVNLWVDVRDTMLLLPEGYKSLEKASTFIKGYEKIDLPDEVKSNMYQFLQDEPEKFEKYALRDAEVTLKLFIKLQYLLNVVNGTVSKMFSTLASATTSHFKSFSENRFQRFNEEGIAINDKAVHNMQFDRLHSLYKKHESLADRSYMGGLNSSYYIGHCEGYTFLDIDFKNAYPTAMNLLKIGDFGHKQTKPKSKKSSPFIEGLE